MKRKFILILAAVMLIIVMFTMALPAMSPETIAGPAAAADLTALGSEAIIIDSSIVSPAWPKAEPALLLVALSAILLTLVIAYSRDRSTLFTTLKADRSKPDCYSGALLGSGGVDNKFIFAAS